MKKVLLEQFEKMMAYDVVENNACIEVEFRVDGSVEYESCWLGKTVGREVPIKADYWYGLMPDGSESYNFDSLHDFVNAPVFHGENIRDIWDCITLISIDGCDIDWRLTHYLGAEPGSIRSPAPQPEDLYRRR